MAGIVNMIANMLVPAKTAVSAPVRTGIKTEAMNPYANPFVSVKGSNPFANYAKNKPVAGGILQDTTTINQMLLVKDCL